MKMIDYWEQEEDDIGIVFNPNMSHDKPKLIFDQDLGKEVTMDMPTCFMDGLSAKMSVIVGALMSEDEEGSK